MSANLEKQMVALGRVLQTLREEENIDVLIETTLTYIQTEFDYSLIWMGLYDRLEHRLVGKGGIVPQKASVLAHEMSAAQAILKQRFPLNPGDLLEQVVIQQRPVGVPDLREEKRAGDWRKAAQQLGIQGTIIFPIRYRALCLGVVLLGSDRWGISPRSEEKARISMILGELAATLNLIEANWHRQQAKRPDAPLLTLLGKLPYLPTLNQRLEAVVTETHNFILPTRTNIYWFEREGRYFWKRAGNLQKTPSPSDSAQVTSGLTVQDMSSFYQALVADQVVSIGSSRSTLKPETTGRLLSQIKARSLLAAPILYQNELLGFLAVEGTEPRIWDESEKNYVRAAAQLVALTAPLEETELAIAAAKQDQVLTSEIVRAIYSDEDWKTTLDQSSHLVCDRLGATRFIVLLRDLDQQRFDIAYQSQPAKRRSINAPLPLLSEVDERLLEQSHLPIAIENWDEDLKLTAWRTGLMDCGIRSLVACNTSWGHALEGVLIVAHDVPKSWNKTTLQLVFTVGQQIGSLLHQWQMQRSTTDIQKLYADIQWGLTTLQQMGTQTPKSADQSAVESKAELLSEKLSGMERVALQQIAQILQAPLTVLVTWEIKGDWRHQKANTDPKTRRLPQTPTMTTPSPYQGRLMTWQDGGGFVLPISLEVIAVRKDPLIQMILAHDGVCRIPVDRIPPPSRSWLSLSGVREVLALALRTAPEHEPTGVILVADQGGRQWVQRHLDAFGMLVTQLAWSRRNLVLSTQLQSQQEELECLNWYKQRRIEDAYHTLASEVRKLNELGTPKDALTVTRYQQGLRQLENAIAALTQMLKDEQWSLKAYSSTMPVVSLLKRAFMRVDRYIKERQLWLQVHGETGALNLTGDIFKIELVVYELLLLACLRSPQGGRIDIWCQPQAPTNNDASTTDTNPSTVTLDPSKPRALELSITDSGKIDSRLVSELQSNVRQDILSASPLNRPPGLNLLISQSVIRQLGGDLSLYQLDDGRVLSRLLLPIR